MKIGSFDNKSVDEFQIAFEMYQFFKTTKFPQKCGQFDLF